MAQLLLVPAQRAKNAIFSEENDFWACFGLLHSALSDGNCFVGHDSEQQIFIFGKQ